MDFSLAPEIEDYRRRIARFVEAEILPAEADPAAYEDRKSTRLNSSHNR
jgi:acyl-CoA dehydrogenase